MFRSNFLRRRRNFKKQARKGIFRHFLENFDQKNFVFFGAGYLKISIFWRQKRIQKNFRVSQRKKNISIFHLISRYFTQLNLIPFAVKIHKLNRGLKTEKNLLECEATFKLNTTLRRMDFSGYDVWSRKLMINFEILSVQEWTEGFYYLSFEVIDSNFCYMFGRNGCSFNVATPNSTLELCSNDPIHVVENDGYFEVKLKKTIRIPCLETRCLRITKSRSVLFHFGPVCQK